MSYILDALRRSQAERERERGLVPGLDAHPATAATVAPARVQRSALWLGAGLALGGIAAVAALWPRHEAPVGFGAPVAAPARPAARVAAAAPALPIVPAPVPAPPPPTPRVVSAPPPAPVVAAPSARSDSAAPLPLAGLDAAQRRDLPPLAISGSIWSDNAASRFVIVNGQVVREGQLAAPGVVLERIAPKAAVVRWRDLRIELPL